MQTKELPQFNTKELSKYNGHNPLILQIRQRYINSNDFSLTSFENEYLIRNFRFSGYDFKRIKISLNPEGKTAKRIKSEYNLDKIVDSTSLDTIIGETSDLYHVSCRMAKEIIYFWLYKDEIGDLYEIINNMNMPIDVEYINGMMDGKRLKQHQVDGTSFLVNQMRAFLFDTVGAGKTYTSIAATIAAKCKKVLIICLSGKKRDWQHELKVFGLDCKIIDGKGVSSKGVGNWDYTDKQYTIINFDIISSHLETGRVTKNKPKLHRPLLDEKYDCIIVDEIQRVKSSSTARSKTISILTASNSVKYVFGLSGTPIEKNLDFANICLNLNIGISDLLYTSYNHDYRSIQYKLDDFKVFYCHGFKVKSNGVKPEFWILGKKTKDGVEYNSNTYELRQRMKFKQRRIKTENVVEGFPLKTREKLWYNLSSKETKEYDELFEMYVKSKNLRELADKDLMKASLTIQKDMTNSEIEKYYYQFVSEINRHIDDTKGLNSFYEGVVKKHIEELTLKFQEMCDNKRLLNKSLDEEEIKRIREKLKIWKPSDLESYREIIETMLLRQYLAIKKVPHILQFIKEEIECGNNVIVFTHFIEELALFEKGLKSDIAVIVHNNSNKQQMVDEYMSNDKKKVIVGNITSIGTGLNITKADVVVFGTPNWNGGEHEQAEGRTWRIGRDGAVRCYYPTFENTLEERVFYIAEQKQKNTSIFFDEKSDLIE